MPSPEAILSLAATTANEYRMLAIGWHVFLGAILVALLAGWRPSNRFAGCLLAAPLLSVSVLAWASGNPFNGATFAALALLLFGFATRMSKEPINVASSFLLLTGALLVAFGWTYPHFLTRNHWTAYTYAAPFGLLPCPTLSAVIGLTLVLGMLRSQAWSMTLAAAGFAYGAMGVFTLGVTLDYGLLAGATLLGVVAGVSTTWRSERTDRDERTRREDAA
jgi:hypothetical protein